jgi:small multidrug resistance family-3 protein
MSPFVSRIVEFLVMLLAAAFEVGGDAMIRAGMRQRAWLLGGLGALTLAAYGVVVNLLPMDFSKLLATYVVFFAIVSVVAGKVAFRDEIPISTWVGLAVIVAGGVIIQVGRLR